MILLGLLTGSWLLRRSIDNGVSMSWTATIISHDSGRFAYHEHGRLRLADGQEIDGERRYLFEECDGGFNVLFAESPPRLFHRVALIPTGSSLTGEAAHLCGDDRYDSRYRFDADGSFTIEHAVMGPRKRYRIETLYTRRCLA
jgi:hypothetical protein